MQRPLAMVCADVEVQARSTVISKSGKTGKFPSSVWAQHGPVVKLEPDGRFTVLCWSRKQN